MDDVVNTTTQELPQRNKWQPTQYMIGRYVYYRADEVAGFISAYKSLKLELAALKNQIKQPGPR